VTVLLAAAGQVAGQSFRFVAPDGTVHVTNAPNDPRYRRMGGMSGTDAGWLNFAGIQPNRYASEITEAAERYGVDPRLVEAVIRAESAFNPGAVSRKGARGLMQLMPATASLLGVRDAFNPRQNIDGGVRHLRGLMDRYPTDLRLVLAAYNAGHQAVSMYGGVPPYPETRQYVERILRDYRGEVGAVTVPESTYHYLEPDGTIVYTNIPRRPQR
jgi:soluble lytic murein transglycosylase-like protein